MSLHHTFPLAWVYLLFLTTTLCADHNWPQWRGPTGLGTSEDANLPVTWNDQNIVWRARLKGRGQSSPVVWGERIFLTASLDEGRQRLVMCLDRKSGQLLWEHNCWSGVAEPTHSMNLWASATCATDGERVVAFFGKGGIHCLTVEGQPKWSRELGDFPNPWGSAASPIIVGDLVIQNCDAEADACLIALDKETGQTRWRTARENLRGWSTPLLVHTPQRMELVLNGERGVTAYDPQTGDRLWFCRGDRGRGSPTVTRAGDLLIAVSGRPGDMFAMRPGGSGTVNATHEVWRTKRSGGRDLPSPIVVGDFLVVVNLRPGIATCYEAGSGKELSKVRLQGNFSASPIAANGLVYLPNEAGETFVLQPDKRLRIVARNRLTCGDDEIFRASLTPCDGQILCRSDRVLYCIGHVQ